MMRVILVLLIGIANQFYSHQFSAVYLSLKYTMYDKDGTFITLSSPPPEIKYICKQIHFGLHKIVVILGSCFYVLWMAVL